MKKLSLLMIMCIMASSMVFAQRKEVRKANSNMKKGNFEAAMEHIANAIQDESTGSDAKTWLLKADIYMKIAGDSIAVDLVEKPLEIAEEAVNKAKELDEGNQNMVEIQQKLLVLSEMYFNAGAIDYENQRYNAASARFYKSFSMSQDFGSLDTVTLYNAGIAAEIGRDFDLAYERYEEAYEFGYKKPELFSSLTSISLAKNDFENAERWIKEGRDLFPDDLNLIFVEANVYLQSGNIKQARRVLELAIEKDPDNANLHFAFGVNFDQMSKDTTFSEEDRNFAYEQAIKAYETAIELNPEYFDAIYNLGAIHFNAGIELFQEAEAKLRKDMNFKAYEETEKEIKQHWLTAQPYMEKSREMISEDDENYEIVLRSLRELYARTQQDEKLEEINQTYKKLFGGEEEE